MFEWDVNPKQTNKNQCDLNYIYIHLYELMDVYEVKTRITIFTGNVLKQIFPLLLSCKEVGSRYTLKLKAAT